MVMDLTGINNQNEYYTNHYFTSIFQENAEDTINGWKDRKKDEGIDLPWAVFRNASTQYYRVRDRYLHTRNEEASKPYVQEMAELYLNALGFVDRKSVIAAVGNDMTVPVYHEETRNNGAPLLWAFLCVAQEREEDILESKIFSRSDDADTNGESVELKNDEILAKLFFAGDEAPRFIILIGINQIALIDRNKWSEKRFLQFNLDDIFSRHEESTFMALTVLLHKESLCPSDGTCVLDGLDENSHKHSAGVSDALKYALRECIEILGNEVIYDMKTRQGIDLHENPVDAGELTLECLRYMYRFLFMLFIEARPELGYAPMKTQTYVQGYSLEGIRDVCDRVDQLAKESETVAQGYYIDDTISELFRMIYEGYPGDLAEYKKALEEESLHDVFTIEALKAHIFDPEYTKHITNARLRNCAMLQIVDLMSISKASGRTRAGRISYSALGINQMGAVYEALLSYRGFIAEETLFEVKRAGDKFNELDVGYFIPENELVNYTEDERVRYEKGPHKGELRKYEQGTFIYRLAGREREKSASYYTPEVLTKCLVKYALKELLKDKCADEILNLTICEPAMGSAAFLNEAINQLAEAYLTKKQEELGDTIPYDERFNRLQEVKMFIADRNVYGCDLNPIAVELAEVSLWLNTIYKGAYVPWFGTQLVNGNSLIGARRQVYYTSKLERGKWYEEAPDRVMPGEKRKRTGVTSRVYHFLLGDPGMSNYTDKVIKNLEPENIKRINEWQKEFTKKYSEEEIQTLLRLSDIIDKLWDKTVALRKSVERATSEPLSVYGHDESQIEGSHKTIREKDEIYHRIFKSESMNNAGPYARLKAAMDYWCALWFWPIDKAELLPTRQEFFLDMDLILEGGIQNVSVGSNGQMSMFDDNGNINFDATGNLKYSIEGTQLAIDFSSQFMGLGEVNLDHLRSQQFNPLSWERLAIANQIAEEQRFHHWELEFADVFFERGGFDLIVGNPPWIKIEWNEKACLSDVDASIVIHSLNTKEYAEKVSLLLADDEIRRGYFCEYQGIAGIQNFLNATENYAELVGMRTNLYKCFLPLSYSLCGLAGVFSFVHPDGSFDDPMGDNLRRKIYPKLKYHFQFSNELKLFADVDHHTIFSLNVYSNSENDSFDMICNLYSAQTIDECYLLEGDELLGIKDENGNWNVKGNHSRILRINSEALNTFKALNGDKDFRGTKLLNVHCRQLLEVLQKLSQYGYSLGVASEKLFYTQMWNETNAPKEGIIVRNVHFPKQLIEMIYSGPHFSINNPLSKTSRKVCKLNSDYDSINLTEIPFEYIQRCNYSPALEEVDYNEKTPVTQWGRLCNSDYRIAMRNMFNLTGERTMISAIIPPQTGHIHAVLELCTKRMDELLVIQGALSSLVVDFYIKAQNKGSGGINVMGSVPILSGNRARALINRVLALNCLNSAYSSLWEKMWNDEMKADSWGRNDDRLTGDYFLKLSKTLSFDSALRKDFDRREAMLEIDVLVAQAIGMTIDELIAIYRIQFPVLQSYDKDTWYDRNGSIIFTSNRGLTGVGLGREEWKNVVEAKLDKYVYEYTEQVTSDEEIAKEKEYLGPFSYADRESDYMEIWDVFADRFK